MKKTEGLKKVISCENNVENLNNIKKMAKTEGLEDIVILCKSKIKELTQLEQQKIRDEIFGEENNKGWKNNLGYCARCNKEIDFEFKSKENYGWKIDKAIFCSYSCYSKTFEERKKKGK